MNPFEISNHEKQKEKHAAIQFFRSLLASRDEWLNKDQAR
jgi:hypothetical protein